MSRPVQKLLSSLRETGAAPHVCKTLDWVFPLSYVGKEVEVRKSEKGLGLFAREKVRPETDILIVPAQFSITNHDMHGLAKAEEKRFRLKLEESTKAALLQYTPNTEPILNLMVGVCQLAAGLADPSMHHSVYSRQAIQTPLNGLPAFFPRETVDLLQGSVTHAKFRAHVATIEKVFLELVSKNLPGLDKPTFVHLFNYVRSRFVNLQPDRPDTSYDPLVLCPLIELANHSPAPNCRVHPFFDRIYDESAFSLRANREILPGEELEVCYGSWGRFGSA